MTPQQAGVSAEAVAKLVEKWRKRAKAHYGMGEAGGHLGVGEDACADELEAALATAPPEQDALEELQAKYDSLKFQWDSLQDYEHARFVAETECGCDSSKGVLCDAHNPIMQGAERSLMQPQAASAGALSAELTDLTHTRSCPMLNPISEEFCTCGLEWRIKLRTEMEMHNAWRKRAEEAEAALAAHDQKVREQIAPHDKYPRVRNHREAEAMRQHDQKVRAEVLEEAAKLAETSNGMDVGLLATKIRSLASGAEEKKDGK